MHVFKSLRLAALAMMVALAAGPLRAAAPFDVVASFSILGDVVTQVGGERVRVITLVGPDEDAHAYQARPSDARLIGTARLVVVNGLGFDTWMERLARSAGYRGTVLEASNGLKPLAEHHAHGAEHGDSHDRAEIDPHAWQDVANAQRYVANIAAALAAVDPEGAPVYRDNAARYTAELKMLDGEIRSALASVPQARRKVVSSHDAFAYFGHAYGVRFVAAAGVSNESEPSAAGIAQLIRQLRSEKAAAVFVENVNDPRLIERIRTESGARLGGILYSDALSAADGPAATYLAMMRNNLKALMDALAASPS
jgi:zinc/manganese transport system substrate-binding protein